MLEVSVATGDPREVDADLLAVGVFKGGIEGPGAQLALSALGLERFPVTPSCRGDIGQTLLLAAPGLAAGGLLLVGLGRMDETDTERLRRAAGEAARAGGFARRIATTLAEVNPGPATVEAVAEGFALGSAEHRPLASAHKDGTRLEEAVLLVPSSSAPSAQQAVAHAAVTSRATQAARDLVNLPPGHKRPPELARLLADLASPSCEVTVRDEVALAEGGFGGLLAVGRGSSAPPRLVELRYRPSDPLGSVVLAGKGITYDTGGLNLKRGNSLEWMTSSPPPEHNFDTMPEIHSERPAWDERMSRRPGGAPAAKHY